MYQRDISPNDTEPPSKERQAELEAAYQANVAARVPPYQNVVIRTVGELLWISSARDWLMDFTSPSGWECVNLSGAILSNIEFFNVPNLSLAHGDLSGAVLSGVDFSGITLRSTNLSGADLEDANFSGTDLEFADLSGANLRGCRLTITTKLAEILLDTATCLADVVWNDAPLTRISWQAIPTLGDEAKARQDKYEQGKRKTYWTHLEDYITAARAYRQLAVALRSQGLNEDADHYGYRAQLMQREVYHLRGKRGWWFFWFFLDWLAGYDYKPQRTLICYGIVLVVSTLSYFILALTHSPGMALWTHQMWVALFEAFIASLTSLHGRGLFPGHTESHWQWLIAGVDAVIGLVIEASFVATFVQRFFTH